MHKIQVILKKREDAWDMGIRQVRYNLPTKDFHNKYMSADVNNKSTGVKSARSRSKNKNNSLLESLVKDESNQNKTILQSPGSKLKKYESQENIKFEAI